MFSVNIDKIVGMTDNEKKCYEELRENLKKELNGGKVLAITKNGIGAFKIAYSFVCAGEKFSLSMLILCQRFLSENISLERI